MTALLEQRRAVVLPNTGGRIEVDGWFATNGEALTAAALVACSLDVPSEARVHNLRGQCTARDVRF